MTLAKVFDRIGDVSENRREVRTDAFNSRKQFNHFIEIFTLDRLVGVWTFRPVTAHPRKTFKGEPRFCHSLSDLVAKGTHIDLQSINDRRNPDPEFNANLSHRWCTRPTLRRPVSFHSLSQSFDLVSQAFKGPSEGESQFFEISSVDPLLSQIGGRYLADNTSVSNPSGSDCQKAGEQGLRFEDAIAEPPTSRRAGAGGVGQECEAHAYKDAQAEHYPANVVHRSTLPPIAPSRLAGSDSHRRAA